MIKNYINSRFFPDKFKYLFKNSLRPGHAFMFRSTPQTERLLFCPSTKPLTSFVDLAIDSNKRIWFKCQVTFACHIQVYTMKMLIRTKSNPNNKYSSHKIPLKQQNISCITYKFVDKLKLFFLLSWNK